MGYGWLQVITGHYGWATDELRVATDELRMITGGLRVVTGVGGHSAQSRGDGRTTRRQWAFHDPEVGTGFDLGGG